MTTETIQASRWLRTRQVCERLGLGRSTLLAMVGAGRFPQPVRFSAAVVAWSEQEIEVWVHERRANPPPPSNRGGDLRSPAGRAARGLPPLATRPDGAS